jgi:hypothetical protein
MKKVFLFAALVSSLLFSASMKAQDDDPNVGFYVDGVKVTELNCYSFKNLSVVLPYKTEFADYPEFSVYMTLAVGDPIGSKENALDGTGGMTITSGSFKAKYVKGNYVVMDLFKENMQDNAFINSESNSYFYATRGCLAFYKVCLGYDASPEAYLKVVIRGRRVTGYSETYDAGCSCTRSEPIMSTEDFDLGNTKLILKNRQLVKGGVYKVMFKENVDLSQPCTYPGTKKDLNHLGSSSTQSSGNSSSSSSGNTTVKTTSTTNTSTTASSTTPYTEKHDNGKISVQGQKNKDDSQEGTWKYFDENGKLERLENYKNGIADGEWKYYEEGKLTKTEVYKDGELISTKEVE